MDEVNQDLFEKVFEKDENGAFVNLIIPKNFLESFESLNLDKTRDLDLRGKKPADYTADEVVAMKKYADYVFKHA